MWQVFCLFTANVGFWLIPTWLQPQAVLEPLNQPELSPGQGCPPLPHHLPHLPSLGRAEAGLAAKLGLIGNVK